MKKRSLYLCVLLGLVCGCSNSNKETIQRVTWTGSSHSFADTLISTDGKDTFFNFKYLYLAHYISFQDNGEGILIKRAAYEAPREFYSIVVNDSIKKLVFDLLLDTTILNFKQPIYNPNKEARLYCGFNYLITVVDNDNQEKNINYLPPDANTKLKFLNSIFEKILTQPTIKDKTQIDTLTLDSIVFEKVRLFHPDPPLKSTIKFTPPLNKANRN